MAKVGKEPLFNESKEKRFCRSFNLYDRCRIWLHKKQHSNDCKILCLVLEKDTDNKIGVISAITGFIILRAGGHNELKIVKSQKPYKKKRAYFKELTTIMVAKNLVDKPNWIINIDETGITPYHVPHSVPSSMSSTKAIITAGSAIGIHIRVRCLLFLRQCIAKTWIAFGRV